MEFIDKYNNFKDYFEIELYKKINSLQNANETLISAMQYSVKAGGKRVRPTLMLMTASVLGVNFEDIMPFAIALELIHTYSLIHDDLPSFDNDDYRRGRLTNHKVYGENVAILAGDALLNLAYEICFRSIDGVPSINASRILSRFAGYQGMVDGQANDILLSNNEPSEELLYKIHNNKTGKLITCSTLIPSCFCQDKYFVELKNFGEKLGLLFQITDDILDATATFDDLGKTPRKDEEQNKLTFVNFYGLEKAKLMAEKVYNEGLEILNSIEESEILKDFLTYVYNRKKWELIIF